ncbi:MAG: hypothetical protein A3G40_06395 [Deltaproteobacteria bacterium RIFCSPLOWO2_12_FULL_57_22]|nr:MAG: hypothetical protein A3G40_06395 [Deltaproteobacteria bacterium RIFCSPLOWO2_12_FULL_57_22]
MTRLVQIYTEREHQILGGGFILLLIIAWESVPHLVTLPRALSLFFTTPSKVSETFYELVVQNEFQTHFYVSAVEFLLGLGLAILAGLPLGLVMGRSSVVDAMFDPYVTALNATPRIVFLPLLILWLGLGIWSKVMVVFIGALFPLLINTYEGVKNVDRVLVNVVRSFGANEWQVMKMVVLPNSLPYVVAGLRLAIGRAILGVVVGEFYGATKGLGSLMAKAASAYQVDVVFVGAAIFMGISLIFTLTVKRIEANLSRWRPDVVKTF